VALYMLQLSLPTTSKRNGKIGSGMCVLSQLSAFLNFSADCKNGVLDDVLTLCIYAWDVTSEGWVRAGGRCCRQLERVYTCFDCETVRCRSSSLCQDL